MAQLRRGQEHLNAALDKNTVPHEIPAIEFTPPVVYRDILEETVRELRSVQRLGDSIGAPSSYTILLQYLVVL